MYNETGTYGTDLFTREADKVLNDHDATRPLFLYFAQQAVHVGNQNNPLQVPKKYLDRLGYIGDERRRTFAGNKMMTECFSMMCQKKKKLKSTKTSNQNEEKRPRSKGELIVKTNSPWRGESPMTE